MCFRAVDSLEKKEAGKLLPSHFRGSEALIIPDAISLVSIPLFIGWEEGVSMGVWSIHLNSSAATTKSIGIKVAELRRNRFLLWHLGHPENDRIHPSRSMSLYLTWRDFDLVTHFASN